MTQEEEVDNTIGRVIPRNGDIMEEVGDPRRGMFGAIMAKYGSMDKFFASYLDEAMIGSKDRDSSLLRQLIDKVVPSLQAQALVIDDKTSKGLSEELKKLIGIKEEK